MPILESIREEIELKLPKTKGKVWIYDSLLAKDAIEIEKIYMENSDVSVSGGVTAPPKINIKASNYYRAQDKTLKAMVSKWDFTDNDGKEIEPTLENIKKLPREDYDYLTDKVEEYSASKRLTKNQKKG